MLKQKNKHCMSFFQPVSATRLDQWPQSVTSTVGSAIVAATTAAATAAPVLMVTLVTPTASVSCQTHYISGLSFFFFILRSNSHCIRVGHILCIFSSVNGLRLLVLVLVHSQ